MNPQATKLQAVENDLKQLMANVTRAMEKAQEAVARIASKAATATTETESRLRRVRARHHDSLMARQVLADVPTSPNACRVGWTFFLHSNRLSSPLGRLCLKA